MPGTPVAPTATRDLAPMRSPLRRRCVLGIAAAAAWSPGLGAQPRVRRVGFLSPRSRPPALAKDYYGAFPRRMAELGYVLDRDLVIEWRFADGDYDRLPGMANEFVKSRADVILALGPPGALAAQKATSTIPVVFVVSADPVAMGLVRSMSKPGGNVTGIFNLAGDLSAKQLEVLASCVPKLARAAMLINPANTANLDALRGLGPAAKRMGIEILPMRAQTVDGIDSAFSAMARERPGALIVALDPLFIQQLAQIASLAAKHRLPSIFANREFAEVGGLISYGQNQVEIYERAAGYVDRILRGARPADMPVEQPTRLDLVVNRATSRAIGVDLPRELLVRADTIID